MQASYSNSFDREQGYTESEWRRCLPGAVRNHTLHWEGEHGARVDIGTGHLLLQWQELPMRQIALMRMARLGVAYRFEQVADEPRHAFMKYFDLFMQRGGG